MVPTASSPVNSEPSLRIAVWLLHALEDIMPVCTEGERIDAQKLILPVTDEALLSKSEGFSIIPEAASPKLTGLLVCNNAAFEKHCQFPAAA